MSPKSLFLKSDNSASWTRNSGFGFRAQGLGLRAPLAIDPGH